MNSPYESIAFIVLGLMVIALRKGAMRRYLKWHNFENDPSRARIFTIFTVVGGILLIVFGALSLLGVL